MAIKPTQTTETDEICKRFQVIDEDGAQRFWQMFLVLVGVWASGWADLDGDQTAHARSWCANPLWVHEWGVHVFNAAGERIIDPVAWPKFFMEMQMQDLLQLL